jgi:hypothetical protein
MIRTNAQLFASLAQYAIAPAQLTDVSILGWSNSGQINANVLDHLHSYLQNPPALHGPYEIHPYIHREAAQYNIGRKFLLLGTFPPNSYLRNLPRLTAVANAHPQVGVGTIDYYYGNTGNLWDFFGVPGQITAAAIRVFLTQSNIAISDVCIGLQRDIFSSPADARLFNILPNTLLCGILEPASTIETILFTSGSLASVQVDAAGNIDVNANNNVNTLNIFLHILKNNCRCAMTASGQVDGNGHYYPLNNAGQNAAVLDQDGHIIWYLRIGQTTFRIINLPTPATALGMIRIPFFWRWVAYKAVQNGLPVPPIANLVEYMLQHPNVFQGPPTIQYRTEIYDMAIHNLPLLMTL